VAELRNAVVWLQAVVEENEERVLAIAKMWQGYEQLRTEVAGLTQRMDLLEWDGWTLSVANEAVKQDVEATVAKANAKVNLDLAHLGWELGRVKGTQGPLVEEARQLKEVIRQLGSNVESPS
jgi:hypothetical protein